MLRVHYSHRSKVRTHLSTNLRALKGKHFSHPTLVKSGSNKSCIPSIKLLRRSFCTSIFKHSPPTEQDLRILIESLVKSHADLNMMMDLLKKSHANQNHRIDHLQTNLNDSTNIINQLVKVNNDKQVEDKPIIIVLGGIICALILFGFVMCMF